MLNWGDEDEKVDRNRPHDKLKNDPQIMIKQDLILALLKAYQPDLKINKDASVLLTDYVNTFMEEAIGQAIQEAQLDNQKGTSVSHGSPTQILVTTTHLERILAQLLLDF